MAGQSNLLPKRKRGRQSAADAVRYERELDAFCDELLQIQSSLDFRVSSRGWCYLLEDSGLLKGDFDKAQKLINECRKTGRLPLDICAEDSAREFGGLETIDPVGPDEYAQRIVDWTDSAYLDYTPLSFWEDKDVFIQALVEKIDLKGLFGPIFQEFHIPFANARGWSDLNSRAALMRRFMKMEREGKRCVLLYCGDHDPGGLNISEFLRSNMQELAGAVGWSPENLVIDRFGLNIDFIEEQGLTWIDNLETSSGRRLDSPSHLDYHKSYVQSYLRQFGARKVEANALVKIPKAARALCRRAILRYLPNDALEQYNADLEPYRARVQTAVIDLFEENWS